METMFKIKRDTSLPKARSSYCHGGIEALPTLASSGAGQSGEHDRAGQAVRADVTANGQVLRVRCRESLWWDANSASVLRERRRPLFVLDRLVAAKQGQILP
jgi:hypothetical protein